MLISNLLIMPVVLLVSQLGKKDKLDLRRQDWEQKEGLIIHLSQVILIVLKVSSKNMDQLTVKTNMKEQILVGL